MVPEWVCNRENNHTIHRTYNFHVYNDPLKFLRDVGSIAQQEQHHPDIYVLYKTVKLDIYTHKVLGVTHNDFILASKINQIKRYDSSQHSPVVIPLNNENFNREVSIKEEKAHLKALPEWEKTNLDRNRLAKSFTCADFNAAMSFVYQIASYAQLINCFPDLYIYEKTVKVNLTNRSNIKLCKLEYLFAEEI